MKTKFCMNIWSLSILLCKCTQNAVYKKLGHLLYRFYFLFLRRETFCKSICYQMKNLSNQRLWLLIPRKKHSSLNMVTLSTLLCKCTQNVVSKKLGHLLYSWHFLFLQHIMFYESICYQMKNLSNQRVQILVSGKKIHSSIKGSFTNYVYKILAFFDHLPTCVDIFYGMIVDKKWTF